MNKRIDEITVKESYFDNREYKEIFKNRDKIQLDFIEKLQNEQADEDDAMRFVLALMSDFVAFIEGKNIKYFELPKLTVYDLSELAVYDAEDNKIVIRRSSITELVNYPKPANLLLKMLDTIGHEMTHYMQYRNLCEKVQLDHNARVGNDEFFIQDDNLFDEWTLKVIRATLDKHTTHKVRNSSFQDLEMALNYNRYFLATSEKGARKGGLAFQDKMMDKFSDMPIAHDEMWKTMMKLHRNRYYKRKEAVNMKDGLKMARQVTSKFMVLEPDMELLKYQLSETAYRENLLEKSCNVLLKMPPKDLELVYWRAVKDGNNVMSPFLIQLLERTLPCEEVDKIRMDTFKFIHKDKEAGNEEKAISNATLLLYWNDFTPQQVAHCLYKGLNNSNSLMMEQYFLNHPIDDFYHETLDNLLKLVTPHFDSFISILDANQEDMKNIKGEYFIKQDVLDFKNRALYVLGVCKKMLYYTPRHYHEYDILSSYQNVLQEKMKQLNLFIKNSQGLSSGDRKRRGEEEEKEV